VGPPISGAEVAEVVEKLFCDKGWMAYLRKALALRNCRRAVLVDTPHATLHGHRRQGLWTGRSGWWSPSLKRVCSNYRGIMDGWIAACFC